MCDFSMDAIEAWHVVDHRIGGVWRMALEQALSFMHTVGLRELQGDAGRLLVNRLMTEA